MATRSTSTLLAIALSAAALLVPGAASATIFYDFTGTCEADCSRFGTSDGAAFSFSKALGLADGTDVSAGMRAVAVEHFEIFGLDLTPSAAPTAMFSDDGTIQTLLTGPSESGSMFCFGVAGLTCDTGRFDTIVPSLGVTFAAGGDGHGPGLFSPHVMAATVPEPVTPAMLGLGLVLFGLRQRVPTAA